MAATILVLAAVAAAVFFALRAVLRDKKSGKSGCGCHSSGGCTGSCAGSCTGMSALKDVRKICFWRSVQRCPADQPHSIRKIQGTDGTGDFPAGRPCLPHYAEHDKIFLSVPDGITDRTGI